MKYNSYLQNELPLIVTEQVH